MKIFDIEICTPAVVYFVFALVMMLVGYFLKLNVMTIGQVFSQLLSIIVCTLLLMGLCTITPTASWIFTGLFIFLSVASLVSMMMGWAKISYSASVYGQEQEQA